MRFWAPGPDPSVAATRERIAAIEAHWQAHGFGDRAVVSRGLVVGFAGLHLIPDVDEVNIGCALERSAWGRGLGTEVYRRLLDWGFGRLGLPEVVAVIDPANDASIALARRCGLTLWRRFEWAGHDRLAYRITADDWAARARRA